METEKLFIASRGPGDIDEFAARSKVSAMLRPNLADQESVKATGLEHRLHFGDKSRVFLLVHGRTGDSSVMWGFSRVFSEFDPFTLAPQAPDSDPLKGFSWWPVTDPSGAPASRLNSAQAGKESYLLAVRRMSEFLQAAANHYQFSLENLHGIGFSQGAGLLAGLSLLEPRLFKSVTMLAGFVPKILFAEADLIEKIAAGKESRQTKYFIGHGTEDDVISIARAREGVQQLKSLGLSVEAVEDEVGHKVGSGALRRLTEFYKTVL